VAGTASLACFEVQVYNRLSIGTTLSLIKAFSKGRQIILLDSGCTFHSVFVNRCQRKIDDNSI
jgi:hypothetical protein